MKLSVIVPVYNVETYLKQCLDSLLAQTLKDMEIIAVNDGSTDSSEEILKDYQKKYPDKIRYVNKENGGLSSARNFGLKYADAQYVTFLDSDDYLKEDAYEKMICIADQEMLDVVCAGLLFFWEDHKRNFSLDGFSTISPKGARHNLLLAPQYAWNKIYRLDFFKNNHFQYPEGLWFEDIPVTTKMALYTDKIGYVDEILYYYRQRTTSIMAAYDNPKLKDIYIVLESVYQNFKQEDKVELFYDELEFLFIKHLMLYDFMRMLKTDRYKMYYEMSTKKMDAYFPKWKKNPYLDTLGKKNKVFLLTMNKFSMILYRKYLLKRD